MHLQFAYALAGALFCSMPVAANACQAGDARLAGHYYLNGVMEVGSELLLKKDGSFEFALAYGANDQYGKGCWVRKGSTVEVIPAGRSSASTHHTPDDSGFSGLVLTVSGSSLVWDINGSGHKGRFEK
ncbi:hypothetical protein LB515_06995 [Mesorhizobium sp. CA15]|uniref:hypothetical protein n=1 Tax=unclassified Mesorhizobium TaxID=325217 RepID=UPI00112C69B6|nr:MULTISPECIES: hypothetical protein [unclassified Mesorhizobium]MBZ9737298.1 hypothetical protein [Mesorhizobium sp. CA9]MBZ9826530.1 hypothetical protein [Mesorhizobium sp. CA18]MBZ9830757.1 hypothetical protein [Mesorhizobium sp. CA2]MBZ9835567.1 hypothetical protein [Mesorhizobium sp. CA3]MBZ9865114.1 hypothetical protein [Mesorhizobium sp. CA15]